MWSLSAEVILVTHQHLGTTLLNISGAWSLRHLLVKQTHVDDVAPSSGHFLKNDFSRIILTEKADN